MNNHEIIPTDVSWKEITKGGTISCAGNATYFKTGDWKSKKPIYLSDKCKQCLLCVPMCPDNAIPIDEEGKRVEFNYDRCKGCGVCAKTCPFGAIKMEGDEA